MMTLLKFNVAPEPTLNHTAAPVNTNMQLDAVSVALALTTKDRVVKIRSSKSLVSKEFVFMYARSVSPVSLPVIVMLVAVCVMGMCHPPSWYACVRSRRPPMWR
jgi:hypothetical protein